MTTPVSAHPRHPLDPAAVARLLRAADWDWPVPVLLDRTPSTNADLADAARDGAPEGTSEAAELQTAGRGRLGRSWEAPPGAGLTLSVLLRPTTVDPLDWGRLPLLAGVAVASALRDATGVAVDLKWPNDLVVPGPRKLGGILVERVGDASRPAAVVGIGLDVAQRQDELPVPTATSLALQGAPPVPREELLVAVLLGLRRWYLRWVEAAGDPGRSGLRDAYRALCSTLGERVRVERSGAAPLVGLAVDVDDRGRLLVRPDEGGPTEAVSIGDVVHLRGAGS